MAPPKILGHGPPMLCCAQKIKEQRFCMRQPEVESMNKPFQIPYFRGVPIDLCETTIWITRCHNLEINLYLEKQASLFNQHNFTNNSISSFNATMSLTSKWTENGTKVYKNEAYFFENNNWSNELMTVCEEIMDIFQNPLPLIEPYRCFPQLSLCMRNLNFA